MFSEVVFPPFGPLETQDLVLRELTAADAESYFAICSDPIVMRTWGTPPHRTLEDTHKLLVFLRQNYENGQSVRWGIFRKSDSRLIGDAGFWRFVKERYRAEIGAKLERAAWGQGYVTQALTAIIAFGFEKMGLHSVEANVDPENLGAMKLVEKVGFLQEGLIHEHSYSYLDGKFRDTALFSVIKGKWKPC